MIKSICEKRTVVLRSFLIMRSVFYVEDMPSDLISVGQLMDENICVVQLVDNFLVIQDRTTRAVIGVGKREAGSFYFYILDSVEAVKTSDEVSYDLWHHRLGHPSATVISLISDVISSNNLNKACEICIRAKQTRDSFSLITNKSIGLFELVHCDVWGPYRTHSHSGAPFFLKICRLY